MLGSIFVCGTLCLDQNLSVERCVGTDNRLWNSVL